MAQLEFALHEQQVRKYFDIIHKWNITDILRCYNRMQITNDGCRYRQVLSAGGNQHPTEEQIAKVKVRLTNDGLNAVCIVASALCFYSASL